MDAVTSYRVEFPVSVWMRKVGLDTTHSEAGDMQKPHPHATPTPRVIVVIEPVERSSALFSLSASHLIASCDPWFSCLFGFEDSLEVIGKNVTDLIPSLKLPASLRELPQVKEFHFTLVLITMASCTRVTVIVMLCNKYL